MSPITCQENIVHKYSHGYVLLFPGNTISFCKLIWRILLKFQITHYNIPQRDRNPVQSQKFHNAPILYPTMHHFVTEMCADFCRKMVHIEMSVWCTVGLWDEPIFLYLLGIRKLLQNTGGNCPTAVFPSVRVARIFTTP